MLWIDKYQPRCLDDLICHPDTTKTLAKLVLNHENMSHLLFYGPSGAGKKTRISVLLRSLFGPEVDKVKVETISPEGTNAEFVTCSSAFHNQISAPELGTKDRVCIQYMIKQLAAQVSASTFSFVQNQNRPKYKIFVLQEAETLSVEAQAALRRTLEKYVRNARVVMHCQQLSSIILPIRSRCFSIRVPLPTHSEIGKVLKKIIMNEHLTVTDRYLTQIVEKSDRNLRKAILLMENAAVFGFPAVDAFERVPWEQVCVDISQKIQTTQSPKCLQECREKIYDLLCACIPGKVILKTICLDLIKSIADQKKLGISNAAAHYSLTLKLGSKDAWHIEAFLAQCMCVIKGS